MTRRGYLDWLRGVATLLMIEAHTMDAWTLPSEREGLPYRAAILLGGFAAPSFLALAGVALALAATSRERRGLSVREAGALARRRGWQIFGLAFLFRLQAFLISGGRFPDSLFKVDILNVMGLAMVLAGAAWSLVPDRKTRNVWLIATTVVLVLLAPLARNATWLEPVPEWLQMYLRSIPGRTSFSLFPWPGFLFAGVAIGTWLAGSDVAADERIVSRIGWYGLLLAGVGAAARLLPPFGGEPTPLTIAPSFSCIRIGLLMAATPLARAWVTSRPLAWSPLREFGVASLFVYWIHVEMAYGTPARPIHRALTVWEALAATLALMVLLYGLVRLKSYAAEAYRQRRHAAA